MKAYSQFVLDEKKDVIICPSILSADFSNLGDDIRKIENDADWVHIDVMDGVYVPNISFGVPIVKAIKKVSSLPLDVHLMITDPLKYVKDFADAGADMLVIHQEACTHIHRGIEHIKSFGVMAGVAINPGTSLTLIEEILPYVDMILLMTVNPGFGGQSYIPTMTEKIRRLKNIRDENSLSFYIQVDGGIGPANIREVYEAGVDAVVAGSSVFNSKDKTPADAIKGMRKCLL